MAMKEKFLSGGKIVPHLGSPGGTLSSSTPKCDNSLSNFKLNSLKVDREVYDMKKNDELSFDVESLEAMDTYGLYSELVLGVRLVNAARLIATNIQGPLLGNMKQGLQYILAVGNQFARRASTTERPDQTLPMEPDDPEAVLMLKKENEALLKKMTEMQMELSALRQRCDEGLLEKENSILKMENDILSKKIASLQSNVQELQTEKMQWKRAKITATTSDEVDDSLVELAPAPQQDVVTAAETGKSLGGKKGRRHAPSMEVGNPTTKAVSGSGATNREVTRDRPAGAAQAVSWSKVVGRKEKRTTRCKDNTAGQPGGIEKQGTEVKKYPRGPKTAAVIIREAEGGQKAADLIKAARSKFSLHDMGVEIVRIRRSRAGWILLETRTDQEADKLTEGLQELCDGKTTVGRPVAQATVRLTGVDPSMSHEEVRAEIARKLETTVEYVRVTGNRGGMVKFLRLPTRLAAALIKEGTIAIGWTRCRATWDQRPAKCFRCHGFGHLRAQCKDEEDRSAACFACGQAGHRAADCRNEPSCRQCKLKGLDSKHRSGDKYCKVVKTVLARGPEL